MTGELNQKRVLVLGLGQTGLSLARHLVAAGAVPTVADTREQPPGLAVLRETLPEVRCVCGPLWSALFDGIDLVAVSPGVAVSGPLADPEVAAARARGIPMIGDIELFAGALAAEKLASGYDPKVLAVTGTNGKTTVTALAAHLARAAGKRALAAGNIGPAVLDAWAKAKADGELPDIWVLEVSSFQLETTHSLQADAAVVLNLSEDHLDRHGDMTAYAAAKARVFAGGGVQVLNRDDPRTMAMRRPFIPKNRRDLSPVVLSFGRGEPRMATDYGLVREAGSGGLVWLAQGGRQTGTSADSQEDVAPQRLVPQDVLGIKGEHNALNALAALALNRAIGLRLAPMLKALPGYAGEAHRVQPVADVAGVRYVDDSKGTNVGATLAALHGLGQALASGCKLLLIAGGEGKGQDFSPLAAAVAASCRAVMLIGRAAPVLRDALAPAGIDMVDCESVDAAVQCAAHRARVGDTVLLSPACASFDMFRGYAHRAEVFVAAVRALGRSHEAPVAPDFAAGGGSDV